MKAVSAPAELPPAEVDGGEPRVPPERTAPMAMAENAATFAVDRLPAHVAAHYRHAAEHADVYRDVPCYCGCDTFAEHAHLLDCFVRDDGGEEPHAAGCGICLAEAAEVRELLAAGRTPSQVRNAVIDTFGPTTNPSAA